jgi:phage portal protein BeeE
VILRTRHNGDVNTRAAFSEPSMSRITGGMSAGMSVTSTSVYGIPSVYAAVRLAAGELASHPFRVWRGVAEQRKVVTTTWQASKKPKG